MQVCFLLHGHKCSVTNGRNSHFFRLTHSTKLQGVNTPLTSKFKRVNSTHRTDLKGVKIGSSASKTRKVCFNGSPDSINIVHRKCSKDTCQHSTEDITYLRMCNIFDGAGIACW